MKNQAIQLIENSKLIITQALKTCAHQLQITINKQRVIIDFRYGSRVTTVKVSFNFTFTSRDFFHRQINGQVIHKIIRFIEKSIEGATA